MNIKKDLEQKVDCPMCKKQLNLNNFQLIFKQEKLNKQLKDNNENINNIIFEKNDENDENDDKRKLKIKCYDCNEEFESDSITTLLYLFNLLN